MAKNKTEIQPIHREETDKLTIIGAGFSGLMTALLAYLEYRVQGKKIRITVIGDQAPTESPASNLCASLSHNEILAVTPSPAEAKAFIEQLFTTPGGLAATLAHLDTPKAKAFIDELYKLAEAPEKLKNDQAILEKYGEYCMVLWQRLIDILHEQGDTELLDIFESYSSFRLPAAPGVKDNGKNHRMDIYINTPSAALKTSSLVNQLKLAGYPDSRLLSPDEYLTFAPYSQAFVDQYSTIDASTGKRSWCEDVSVARRPAGRINANQFMKHITGYLERGCGKYVSEDGEVKSYFRVKTGKVTQLLCQDDVDPASKLTTVVDVQIVDPATSQAIETHRKDRSYGKFFYTINTGSRAQATNDLGIRAPNNALFSGTYMQLRIPMDRLSTLEQNIHTNLALRTGNGAGGVHTSVAQFYPDPERNHILVVHIAGTKTFCGDTEPVRQGALEPFAYDRLLIQLNILRMTFSNLLRPVLGDKVEQPLTHEALEFLVQTGIARIGVESRNVSTTNAPYVGPVIFQNGHVTKNAGLCHAPSSAGIAYAIGNMKTTLEYAGCRSRLFEAAYQQRQADADAANTLMTTINTI